MGAGQLIFITIWIAGAIPFVGLFEYLFDKYDPQTELYWSEGDMRSILGLVWVVTLIPVLIYIGIKIISTKTKIRS